MTLGYSRFQRTRIQTDQSNAGYTEMSSSMAIMFGQFGSLFFVTGQAS